MVKTQRRGTEDDTSLEQCWCTLYLLFAFRVLIQRYSSAIGQYHLAYNERNCVDCVDGPFMVSGQLPEHF